MTLFKCYACVGEVHLCAQCTKSQTTQEIWARSSLNRETHQYLAQHSLLPTYFILLTKITSDPEPNIKGTPSSTTPYQA